MYDGRPAERRGEPFPVGDEVRWELSPHRPEHRAFGTLRSVQIVVGGYAETHAGSRSYEPVAGERWPRPVTTCPRPFGDGTRPVRDGRGHLNQEAGLPAGPRTPGEPASVRPGE